MKSLIIGIAGGSGSGKAMLTRRLQQQFRDHVTVLYHENYYYSHDELSLPERKMLNYDHPKSLDTPLLVRHLKELKKGNPIESPVYDFVNYGRTDNVTLIQPTEVIIVEGILILADRDLRRLLDIKVFVETDADVRLLRRIRRDVTERQRTLDEVVNQYMNNVKPMYHQFVEPSRLLAEQVVVEEDEADQIKTNRLISTIRSHILSQQQAN